MHMHPPASPSLHPGPTSSSPRASCSAALGTLGILKRVLVFVQSAPRPTKIEYDRRAPTLPPIRVLARRMCCKLLRVVCRHGKFARRKVELWQASWDRIEEDVWLPYRILHDAWVCGLTAGAGHGWEAKDAHP